MAELTASAKINLGGNLPSQSDKFAKKVGGIGKEATKSGGKLRGSFDFAGRQIGKVNNRVTALASTIGGIAAIKSVADTQRKFTRLGIQVGASEEKMEALKQTIFDVSQQPGIRIDPNQIIGAVNQIIDKTGDLKFAEENLENLAIAVQATGAAGEDVGQIFVDLKTKLKLKPGEITEEFSRFVEQGKEGAFPLEELANLAPRVLAAYAALNRVGPTAVKEVGSVLQVFRSGVGESANAATALEAVIRDIQNNVTGLEAAGIEIIEDKELNRFRALPDILEDILTKAKANPVALRKIFGDEAFRGITALTTSFDLGKGVVDDLQRFQKVQGDVAQLTADSARAANDATGVWASFGSTFKEVIDRNVLPSLKKATQLMNLLDPEQIDSIISGTLKAGAAIGGIGLARKAGVGRLASRLLFGKDKKGKDGQPVSAGLGNVQRVFVVNMAGGGMGGDGGFLGGTGKGKLGRKAGKFGKIGKFGRGALKVGGKLGKALPFIGAALAVADVASIATSEEKGTAEKVSNITTSLGAPALGAAIGSVLLPGIGTAVGLGVGSLVDLFAGDAIGKAVANAVGDPALGPQKSESVLKIEIAAESGLKARVKNVHSDDEIEVMTRNGLAMGGAR